ncbi:Prefoldin [Xylona heveae TC161]|uniref:Prefoldin n=1 Tax=Xylona heveae (strain CBS 132557 / TC161) TaxID=1328760 RepID=A0A165JIT4_XYLHT|nr:Prefoldin [Xylona heveae TC161]KZF26296.1 Prefoldin [Xylona heveae TC161]
MSIPPEALQKLAQEIETRAVVSQQQIGIVRTQIAAKQRDVRLQELTANEATTLPKDTKVYEGVGKMFVLTPLENVKDRLAAEKEELKSDINNLEKKLQYLETTHKNSRDHIEHMLKATGRS